MLTIVYDRNFREHRDKQRDWHIGDLVPEIEPHRIIELWVDGAEKEHVEELTGSFNARQAVYYGDIARTIYLTLLHNS